MRLGSSLWTPGGKLGSSSHTSTRKNVVPIVVTATLSCLCCSSPSVAFAVPSSRAVGASTPSSSSSPSFSSLTTTAVTMTGWSSSSSEMATADATTTTVVTNDDDNNNENDDEEDILGNVKKALENSWVRQLRPESEENLKKSRRLEGLDVHGDDNRSKRPVYNGHYVLVKPTGLREPRLLLYSQDVADQLGLSARQVESDDFVRWVSGNTVLGETWATPYALSIMGTRYTNNCPYGTGNGYGDGRAISIGEFSGWELQMKGAGTTPFHRGADGRAVLRSSVREFLASEAMHRLRVPTTRALSLVVSEGDVVRRPWYSTDDSLQQNVPKSVDDPRLSRYPAEQRQQILDHLRHQKSDPNILVTEQAAITTRAAPSFVRVGHIDLFARRAERKSMESYNDRNNKEKTNAKKYDTSSNEWKELEEMIWHACYREFRETAYEPYFATKDIAWAAEALLEGAAENLATMVAGWIRVGFAQGNFNADNCLVSGRTMDYGPFGFMEEYNPLFAKWTGSGQHFGFMNQPSAAFANYHVLVSSVVPVIAAARGLDDDTEDGEEKDGSDDAETALTKKFINRAAALFESKVDGTFRVKLGFHEDDDTGDDIWQLLEPILRSSRTDWTLFFRQLTYVVRDFPDFSSEDYPAMMNVLQGNETDRPGSSPFYAPLSNEQRDNWLAWIEQWRAALASSSSSDEDDGNSAAGAGNAVYEKMRLINPKYVLREWMLVDAYTSAARGEEAELYYLFKLIQRPYDEGRPSDVKNYYRRARDEDLTAGGTAYMS